MFRGGGDQDTIEYRNDTNQGGRRGIVVDLENAVINGSIRGTVRDGFGYTDTTFDIERVAGTRYADKFVGSRVDNGFGAAKAATALTVVPAMMIRSGSTAISGITMSDPL